MGDKYKALADDNRRKILKILSDGEKASGDVAKKFKIAQPTISNHLKILTESNIVTSKKSQQKRIYTLNKKKIQQIVSELKELLDS